MKKEDLIALGLTEEQATQVMQLLDGNYVTKTRFNDVNTENKNLKADLADRDKQLETLKASAGDNTALKDEIVKLQNANKEQQEKHDAEIAQIRLDNAIDTALTVAGAKNIKAARAVMDLSKCKLDKHGDLIGFDEILEAAKQSESYLFATAESKTETKQNFKGVSPGEPSGSVTEKSADLSSMTYSEMLAYMAANPDAKIE